MDGASDYAYDGTPVDKEWASRYILGPLYDPEPSQESATHFRPLPTPRPSSSPTRRRQSQSRPRTADDTSDEDRPFLQRVLSRRSSTRTKPLPPSPSVPKHQLLTGLERKRSVHTARPPQTHWNQGTILSRANSVSTSRPTEENIAAPGDQIHSRHHRAGSLAERYPGDRSHRPLEMLTQEHQARNGGGGGGGGGGEDAFPRRNGSLRERYPGDMSHRPLAMLAREHRAADRAPHLHNHRRQQPSDTIDSLDISGPVAGATYHHGGPFDPTLKARNMDMRYSPVEAVRDTNMEALRATPSEYVQDSLDKHVPLQGTAVIPPGMRDMRGRTMHYDEGADLMREEDAAGGPYKRWAHLQYRDDDLKGKGEPAFSSDQARHEQKERGNHRAAASPRGMVYYEMQPPPSALRDHDASTGDKRKEGAAHVHQRSGSNTAQSHPAVGETAAGPSSGSQRGHTRAKSFTQSLKRRFGNMRKKKTSDDAAR